MTEESDVSAVSPTCAPAVALPSASLGAPASDTQSRRRIALGLAIGALAICGSMRAFRHRPVSAVESPPMPTSLRPRSNTSSPELDEALKRPDAFAEVEGPDPLAILDR